MSLFNSDALKRHLEHVWDSYDPTKRITVQVVPNEPPVKRPPFALPVPAHQPLNIGPTRSGWVGIPDEIPPPEHSDR